MKVWVVEQGTYDAARVDGVYADLETAKRENDHPDAVWTEHCDMWHNGLLYLDYVQITPHELVDRRP